MQKTWADVDSHMDAKSKTQNAGHRTHTVHSGCAGVKSVASAGGQNPKEYVQSLLPKSAPGLPSIHKDPVDKL